MNVSIKWNLLRFFIEEMQIGDMHSKVIEEAILTYLAAWRKFDDKSELS